MCAELHAQQDEDGEELDCLSFQNKKSQRVAYLIPAGNEGAFSSWNIGSHRAYVYPWWNFSQTTSSPYERRTVVEAFIS
jgi:hypothetical protein